MDWYIVLLDKEQACYGPPTGSDCAPQGQIFTLEEAMALAKYLNLKEPNFSYTVHRMTVGTEIMEKT